MRALVYQWGGVVVAAVRNVRAGGPARLPWVPLRANAYEPTAFMTKGGALGGTQRGTGRSAPHSADAWRTAEQAAVAWLAGCPTPVGWVATRPQ